MHLKKAHNVQNEENREAQKSGELVVVLRLVFEGPEGVLELGEHADDPEREPESEVVAVLGVGHEAEDHGGH